MCEQRKPGDPVYGQPLPPVIVGGGSGDYAVSAEIGSSRWVEYQVLSVAQHGNGVADVIISPDRAPKALDYTGATTYTTDTHGQGEYYCCGNNTSIPVDDSWKRAIGQDKKVYVRIDTTTGSCFVSLRFRPCLLEVVPEPLHDYPHGHGHLSHIEREQRIKMALGEK